MLLRNPMLLPVNVRLKHVATKDEQLMPDQQSATGFNRDAEWMPEMPTTRNCPGCMLAQTNDIPILFPSRKLCQAKSHTTCPSCLRIS